jgi:hypothetical protein
MQYRPDHQTNRLTRRSHAFFFSRVVVTDERNRVITGQLLLNEHGSVHTQAEGKKPCKY